MRMLSMQPILPFVLATALVAGGCRTDANDREETPDAAGFVMDDLGRAVPVDSPAERVVSLLPSMTELVLALGASERLLARTRHDRDPRVEALPSLGDGMNPSLEALGRLRPDLVIAWADGGDRAVVERLEALGIQVYAAKSQTVEEILRHTDHIGRLLGLEDRADSLRGAMEEGLSEVSIRVADVEPVSVLYVVWHDPPVTTGSGTYLDALITAAGGRNAFADAGGGWPRVSVEEIVRRDPDVIIAGGAHDGTQPEPSWLHELPGWRSLRAVEEGGILVVDADLFNRPGPRVVEAARTLAAFLHPERFPEEQDR